jgi:translation initiation factor 3 subunit F
MLALHLRANRNETVVGWYATAFPTEDGEDSSNSCLANTSSLIHEFYTGECEDAAMDSPVHLVVDTSLVNDSVALKGYISSAVTLNGEPLANMFHEVRLLLKSSESERIVVDEMIRSMGGDANGNANEEKKEESTNSLQVSMEKLLEMLETASDYVGKVVDGTLDADDAIGNQIADTLSSIPRIRPEVFDKMFSDSMQDLLMVSYLSNITKTQLTIAEKLNQALDQE